MDTHLEYSAFERIHNELDLLRWDLLNDLLYYMIPVLIFNAEVNLALDLSNKLILLARGQYFEGFLHNTASVLVAREADHVALSYAKSIRRCSKFPYSNIF